MDIKITALLCAIIVTGCTTTPDQYKKNSLGNSQALPVSLEAGNSKMQALATAQVGAAQQYTDRQSGMTSRLIVESEYFSANGRTCRRFRESVNGRDTAGVGCQDKRNGWAELPLATVLR